FAIKEFVMQNLKNESASPFYQLKKYYPEIHKVMVSRQFEKMGDCVIENLRKGIEQGLFREDINLELIGRFYFAGMTSIKDPEIFDPIQFSTRQVQEAYLEYHLRGISTSKGVAVLENIIKHNNQ
ncbi:MAG: TetR/AcrR family transcriptional regulator, partial [Bacteroidota bacterium]